MAQLTRPHAVRGQNHRAANTHLAVIGACVAADVPCYAPQPSPTGLQCGLGRTTGVMASNHTERAGESMPAMFATSSSPASSDAR
jgi:hypothetical protein